MRPQVSPAPVAGTATAPAERKITTRIRPVIPPPDPVSTPPRSGAVSAPPRHGDTPAPVPHVVGSAPTSHRAAPAPSHRRAPWPLTPRDPLAHRPVPFRLHGADDPAPDAAHMIAICAWATLLGLVGLALAVRAQIAILADAAPSWLEPALAASGLTGILLSVGAFLSIHRRELPYVLLTASTLTLVFNVAMVAAAL